MWPELQAWWQKVMGQSRPMPSQAPMTYRDSVETITGRPRLGVHYAPSATFPGSIDGYYIPAVDVAMVDSYPQDQARREWVTAHELGHRYDARGQDPSIRQAFDSARAVNPVPDGYAGTGRDEHFAEAFAQAISMLRDTAGGVKDPIEAQSMLSYADRNVPSSVAIMRQLMNKPIYANHPMQDYLGMMQLPYARLTGSPLHVVSR